MALLKVRRRKPERVVLSTKAGSLAALTAHLTTARILPLHVVRADRWNDERELSLLKLAALPWAHSPLAVRSSALAEDTQSASAAGKFRSHLGVIGLQDLATAIDDVFASYGAVHAADEVLVQPMLGDVIRSGVVFSRDPNTGAPYRVVNFCDGLDTAAITGGYSDRHRTLLYTAGGHRDDPFLNRIEAVLQELESLTGQAALDIEFAASTDGDLTLLQVRPLVVAAEASVGDEEHGRWIADIEQSLQRRMAPHPFLFGRRTVFGVMPDWNPAEIIGIRPRPLALSLYRELVTNSIWAYQRHNYGYRNLRSFPLLCDFHGLPYIDVRVSFNSFIPHDLPEPLAERLADYYCDALCQRPALHDKVEFEIIFSCYTLDLPDRLKVLSDAGFSQDERNCLGERLRSLTNRIINARNGLWIGDLKKIATLEERFQRICDRQNDRVSRIYWLLEDCKRYGTLPFAGLARAGFVAVQLLRSLVNVGVLEERDYQAFLGSLSTVSGEIGRDFTDLGREAFLQRYGHLRPGTYDIRSQRYDRAPDLYFDWSNRDEPRTAVSADRFALTLPQMNEIDRLLRHHGLEHDVVGLFNFLKAGIEGRENAKFAFTRNLSLALEEFAELGAAYGFSRDDLSYASIASVYGLYGSCDHPAEILGHAIDEGRRRHARTLSLSLPSLIVSPQSARVMEIGAAEPNFVTQREISAPVLEADPARDLEGAIVVIRSADPGFDWLFSRRIGGLITAYGGVNSHMAIRAGELQMPAVIGAGEALFSRWSQATRLQIDCANRFVSVLA